MFCNRYANFFLNMHNEVLVVTENPDISATNSEESHATMSNFHLTGIQKTRYS